MQVIYIKKLKTFVILDLFFLFLAPSTSLRVNSKRNEKLPAADLTPALSEGEEDKKEFFVHLFLQGFAAQKST
jgi:hypothetical protein